MRHAALAIPLILIFATAAAEPFAYDIVDGIEIPEPLGGVAGDPTRGPDVAELHCAACHAMPGEGDADRPSLTVLSAGFSPGRLRLAIVHLGLLNPGQDDHAFYDVPPFDPEADTPPATRLTAEEVEALVAWLSRPVSAQPAP
jgi:hypothetical protein